MQRIEHNSHIESNERPSSSREFDARSSSFFSFPQFKMFMLFLLQIVLISCTTSNKNIRLSPIGIRLNTQTLKLKRECSLNIQEFYTNSNSDVFKIFKETKTIFNESLKRAVEKTEICRKSTKDPDYVLMGSIDEITADVHSSNATKVFGALGAAALVGGMAGLIVSSVQDLDTGAKVGSGITLGIGGILGLIAAIFPRNLEVNMEISTRILNTAENRIEFSRKYSRRYWYKGSGKKSKKLALESSFTKILNEIASDIHFELSTIKIGKNEKENPTQEMNIQNRKKEYKSKQNLKEQKDEVFVEKDKKEIKSPVNIKKTVKKRMFELKELYDGKLIDNDEYKKKKEEILKDL